MGARSSIRFLRPLPPWLVSAGISLLVPLLLVRIGAVQQDMRHVLSGWDGGRFIEVAQHGYPNHLDANDAFFPGYPLLVWAVSRLTHDPVVAAEIVSLTGSLVAMAYIGALARRELPEPAASFAVWLVALFPAAMFLSAAYSDSCFIACAAATLYYARAGRPWAAAIAAMLAGSFRIFGLALVPALAWECWVQGGEPRRWLSLLLAPVAVLAYSAFLYLHTGDALAFAHAESLPTFEVHLVGPWRGALRSVGIAMQDPDPTRRVIYAAALLFAAAAVVVTTLAWLVRLFPRSLAMYSTVVTLLSLSVSSWRSFGRHDLALFPLALLIGYVDPRWRASRMILLAVSAIGLALMASLWATGAWVG
jgi:hypothetical protein